MRRREFITLLAGSAIIWPDAMFAQGSKRPLIAWLSGGEQKASWVFVEAFLQGMHEHGYVEGRSFDIVYRFADGYFERLPVLAEGLVLLHPDVILAPASGPAVAANKATSTIPIVTPALADATHLGLIASESRPGGNVTGKPLTWQDCLPSRWSLRGKSCPARPRLEFLPTRSIPRDRRSGTSWRLRGSCWE
jgi:putative ABC transport system substrate-binding protein